MLSGQSIEGKRQAGKWNPLLPAVVKLPHEHGGSIQTLLLPCTGSSFSHRLTYSVIRKDIISNLSNLSSLIHLSCNVFSAHCVPGMELENLASGFGAQNVTTLLASESPLVSFLPPPIPNLKSTTTSMIQLCAVHILSS